MPGGRASCAAQRDKSRSGPDRKGVIQRPEGLCQEGPVREGTGGRGTGLGWWEAVVGGGRWVVERPCHVVGVSGGEAVPRGGGGFGVTLLRDGGRWCGERGVCRCGVAARGESVRDRPGKEWDSRGPTGQVEASHGTAQSAALGSHQARSSCSGAGGAREGHSRAGCPLSPGIPAAALDLAVKECGAVSVQQWSGQQCLDQLVTMGPPGLT